MKNYRVQFINEAGNWETYCERLTIASAIRNAKTLTEYYTDVVIISVENGNILVEVKPDTLICW